MAKSSRRAAFAAALCMAAGWAPLTVAQEAPAPNYAPPAGKRETAEAARHRLAAQKAAGTEWAHAYAYHCTAAPRFFNRITDPAWTPQQLFDNLAIIGDTSTSVYVLRTTAGVLLIDSSYDSKTQSMLLPQLAKLGIDPADVKTIIVTHGHADHFGGAAYFQSHYKTRIVASEADWPMITAAKGPSRDIVVGDGGEVTLGDLTVHTFLIPGHTPGALGLVFPVREHGVTHMAAIFGGTVLGQDRVPDDALVQYSRSLAHFGDVARRYKVDVELQNHPLFDNTDVKIKALAERKPGAANPFVVGQRSYQNFLTVISECAQMDVAQRH